MGISFLSKKNCNNDRAKRIRASERKIFNIYFKSRIYYFMKIKSYLKALQKPGHKKRVKVNC